MEKRKSSKGEEHNLDMLDLNKVTFIGTSEVKTDKKDVIYAYSSVKSKL